MTPLCPGAQAGVCPRRKPELVWQESNAKGRFAPDGRAAIFCGWLQVFHAGFAVLTCLFPNAVQHALVARSGEGLEIAQHLGRLAAERTERASEPDRHGHR
jgi:hypothetical protein